MAPRKNLIQKPVVATNQVLYKQLLCRKPTRPFNMHIFLSCIANWPTGEVYLDRQRSDLWCLR